MVLLQLLAVFPVAAAVDTHFVTGSGGGIPPIPAFVPTLSAPASLIFSDGEFSPPYTAGADSWEVFSGCDAAYATSCAAREAVKMVSRARAELCPVLEKRTGSEAPPEVAFAPADSSNFGLFVLDGSLNFVADELRRVPAGEALDGVAAGGHSLQPLLRQRVRWALAAGGGWVPHASTRLSQTSDAVADGVLQPVSVSTYLEPCDSQHRYVLAVSVGRMALPRVDACDAESNGFCTVQNARSIVGMALMDFLSLQDASDYESFLFDAAYSERYSVGALSVLISQVTVPSANGSLALRSTWNTILADRSNVAAHGLNTSDAAVSTNRSITEPDPAILEAAARGGGCITYPTKGSDGEPVLGMALVASAVLEGAAHLFAAAFRHQPPVAALGPSCSACEPISAMPCVLLNLERLAGHARADFLVQRSWVVFLRRMTYLRWFGAFHDQAEDESQDGIVFDAVWPPGFFVAVFDFAGLCLAHGKNPDYVGLSVPQILQAEGLSLDGAELHQRFLAVATSEAQEGWVEFGTRIAKVTLLSARWGKRWYSLVSADVPPQRLLSCREQVVDPCIEFNTEAGIGLLGVQLLGSRSAEEAQMRAFAFVADGSVVKPAFATGTVGVFTADWSGFVQKGVSLASGGSVPDFLKAGLDRVVAEGGGWLALPDSDTTFYSKAYVLPLRLADGLELRIVVSRLGWMKPPLCHSDEDCTGSENQICTVAGECACLNDFQSEIVPVSDCGAFPSTTLVCWELQRDSILPCDMPSCEMMCPAGYFCPDKVTQMLCWEGHYCPEAPVPSYPEMCPGGTQILEGPAESKDSCTPCAPGTKKEAGSDDLTCETCDPGEYQPLAGGVECVRCPSGTYANQSGSSFCHRCPGRTTTDGTGYSEASACQCPPGTFLGAASECYDCGEGGSCGGFGAEPLAAPGYYLEEVTATAVSIFSCEDSRFCPGGGVGVCAEGRRDRGCGRCRAGLTPSAGGICRECDSSDNVPFILVSLGCGLVFALLYVVMSRADRSKQNHGLLLVAISGSQLVTTVQTLSVLAVMDLQWRDPIRALLRDFRFLTFDIEVLRMSCVADVAPESVYALKLLLPVLALVYLGFVHVLNLVLVHRCRCRPRLPVLLTAAGQLFMAFFISITLTILSPFQCTEHPNGRWTMRDASTELCWEGSSHTTMITMAALALALPLGFVGAVLYAFLVYPKRMRDGDVRFLNVCTFLFARFRPEARWCTLFLLGRSLVLAVVPALPDAMLQVVLLEVISIVSVVVVVFYMPFRITFANFAEAALSVAVLMFANLASFFVLHVNLDSITNLALVALALGAFCIPLGIAVGVAKYVRSLQKPFRWFICHHKAGAGAMARFAKMELTRKSKKRWHGDVFVDSDNLENLDSLFNTVAFETHTLVALCSAELLTRPWCLGELATSFAHKLVVVPVILPDFQAPSEDFIRDINLLVSLQCVTEQGLSTDSVRVALQNFNTLGGVFMQRESDIGALRGLAKGIVEQAEANEAARLATLTVMASVGSVLSSGNTFVQTGRVAARMTRSWRSQESRSSGPTSTSSSTTTPRSRPGWAGEGRKPTVAIVVDCSSYEALCSAHVLRTLLLPAFEESEPPTFLPEASVGDGGLELLPSVTRCLLVCTNGCWSRPAFLADVARAAWTLLEVVPVVTEEHYRFPTEAFYQELDACVEHQCRAAGLYVDTSAFRSFVAVVFKHIAAGFHIMGSLSILEAQAASIARRLRRTEAMKPPPDHDDPASKREWLGDFALACRAEDSTGRGQAAGDELDVAPGAAGDEEVHDV